LEPLALTILITKKHKSKGGKATHTRVESAAHTHKPRIELKTQHMEFATQTKLNSITQ
jgi:hypothetical protein